MADARPENTPWLSPYLAVADVAAAVDFYERAFGFERIQVVAGADGAPIHASMRWHDALVMMGPGTPGDRSRPPKQVGGVGLTLYLYSEDVDALFARAVREGAEVGFEPEDMFWGDRVCLLMDPDGHAWNFATNRPPAG